MKKQILFFLGVVMASSLVLANDGKTAGQQNSWFAPIADEDLSSLDCSALHYTRYQAQMDQNHGHPRRAEDAKIVKLLEEKKCENTKTYVFQVNSLMAASELAKLDCVDLHYTRYQAQMDENHGEQRRAEDSAIVAELARKTCQDERVYSEEIYSRHYDIKINKTR